MIRFDEWWLPDGETHLTDWMTRADHRWNGRLTYQFTKFQAAMYGVKQRRLAIDIGAHVGLWSWPMSHFFDSVVAFEPMLEHRRCWFKNMEARHNARLIDCALGNTHGNVAMRTFLAGHSGHTGIDPGGSGEAVAMQPLDAFAFECVDFIKIDCEGFEVFVVQGALETITRCKPCIIVEQKPEAGMVERYGIGTTDAVDLLLSLGMRLRHVEVGDYILDWDR